MKRYKLRFLILGLIFGIFITVIHESSREIASFLNIDTNPSIYFKFKSVVQQLYTLPFLPLSVFGSLMLIFSFGRLQYYVVIIGYSIFGLLLGLIYQSYKNNKHKENNIVLKSTEEKAKITDRNILKVFLCLLIVLVILYLYEIGHLKIQG